MTAVAAALAGQSGQPAPTPLLAVSSLKVVLGHGWRAHAVLEDVSLTVERGEVVGLVGETGSGKTTLARAVVGLVAPRRGRVLLEGLEASALRGRARRAYRRRGLAQYVFQDPLRSLDPDMTVERLVGEGLEIRGGMSAGEVSARTLRALEQVGLDASVLGRSPGQISGGQRQRVSIARALATEPKLLICDEPVSALDASNRNHVLGLLAELRSALGLAVLIISHDLSSLAAIADRVVVLYRGRVVENGPIEKVFARPQHPYTALLVASTPSVGTGRSLLARKLRREGALASVALGSRGCAFAQRCPFGAPGRCDVEPSLSPVEPGWDVACHRQREWPGLVTGLR